MEAAAGVVEAAVALVDTAHLSAARHLGEVRRQNQPFPFLAALLTQSRSAEAVVRQRTVATQFLEASPLLVEAQAAHTMEMAQAAVLVVVLAAMLQTMVPVPLDKVMTAEWVQTVKMSAEVVAVLAVLVRLVLVPTITGVVLVVLV